MNVEEKSLYVKKEDGWKQLSIPGIQLKTLKSFPDGGSTVLVKMAPNSHFPLHDHQDGEETFVIEGEIKIGKYRLKEGDYLFTEPGIIHSPVTQKGCTLLSTSKKPISFIN